MLSTLKQNIVFTCPLVLDGEAAASPGFSATVSPFAAVLENCAPMFHSNKELNRSQFRTKTNKSLSGNERLSRLKALSKVNAERNRSPVSVKKFAERYKTT